MANVRQLNRSPELISIYVSPEGITIVDKVPPPAARRPMLCDSAAAPPAPSMRARPRTRAASAVYPSPGWRAWQRLFVVACVVAVVLALVLAAVAVAAEMEEKDAAVVWSRMRWRLVMGSPPVFDLQGAHRIF